MPEYTFHLERGPLTVSAYGPRNGIGWCSDWARVYELVDAGHATTDHGGPGTYGHTDILLSPACVPDAAPETVRLFEPAPAVMPGQTGFEL